MIEGNDIATGFNVATQVPLDFKTHFKTLAEMLDLGINSNKAFKYYKGMLVYCDETKTIYVWDETPDSDVISGMIDGDFAYPANIETNGVVYSGQKYNFFVFSKINKVRTVFGALNQVDDENPTIAVYTSDLPNINSLTAVRDLAGSYRVTHPLFESYPNNVVMITNNMALNSNTQECFVFVKNENGLDGIQIQTYARSLDLTLIDNCLSNHKFVIYFFDLIPD